MWPTSIMLPGSCAWEKGCTRPPSSRRANVPGRHSLTCMRAHLQAASHSQRRQHASEAGVHPRKTSEPTDTLQWDEDLGTTSTTGREAASTPCHARSASAGQAQLWDRQQSHSQAGTRGSSGRPGPPERGRMAPARTRRAAPSLGHAEDAPTLKASSVQSCLANPASMHAAGGKCAEAALARACMAAAEEGCAAEVAPLLREAHARRVTLTQRGHVQALMQAVVAARAIPQALLCVRELPPEGGAPYEALLLAVQGMPQAQQRPAADRVFHAMQRDGRLQGLGTCRPEAWSGLIRLYGRLGLSGSAVAVFEDMRRRGLWAAEDTYCVNLLLDALSDDSAAAFAMLTELEEAGMVPNLVTFNTLLKACMRSKDMPRAHQVLARVRAAGLQGNEHTFNTLIKVASYCGDIEQVLATLPLMEDCGVQPTPAVWGSILVACGKAGQVESAMEVWRRMRASGTPLKTDTCNALMTACVECGHGERALRLLREAQALGMRPDVVTYNLAIGACRAARHSTLSAELLGQAFALLAEMRGAGVEPDLATYTTLMALCRQAGAGRRALALYEELRAVGLRMDRTFLTAVIAALGSQGLAQEALAVFRTMVWGPRRCKPNEATYRAITRTCREAGLVAEALHAYSGMRAVGLKPSNAEWRALIGAAAEAALVEADGGGLTQQVAECLGLCWQEGQSVVDLHGLSTAEARAAVLCVLASLQRSVAAGRALDSDLVLITGVGRHSDPQTGPVLHAAVSQLLNDELKLAAGPPPGRGHAAPPAALQHPCAGEYAAVSTTGDCAAGAQAPGAPAAVAVSEDGDALGCTEHGVAQGAGAARVQPLAGKPTAGQVVVTRATLAAWVAAKAKSGELPRT